jgi:hypothetical protein
MRVKAAILFCFLAALVVTVSAVAQEGHPLTGVWYGEWGPSATHRNQITVVMSWDGKNVTGIVNPGPESIPLKVATLDSTKWMVHIEAEAKDQKGAPVRFVADGKLENIGSYNRTLKGTWSHGNVKGDFLLKRD